MASTEFEGGSAAKHSKVANPEPTMEEAEILEMASDMRQLLDNRLFQKLIVDAYINKSALSVGTSFTGSKSDLELLSAVTHLTNHINTVIDDGLKARG